MRRIIKILILIQFFAGPMNAQSDDDVSGDTIRIREVQINAVKSTSFTDPYTRHETDSSLIAHGKFSGVIDLLAEALPVYPKKYGPGGLATVSLRGTTAVHTTVTWNGLSLSSPMSGQTDMSIIPVILADRVVVEYGGASMFSGSGSFGGNLNLTTEPRWNNPLEINLAGLTGSYGLMSGYAGIATGKGNFSYSARILSEKARNNYRYLNYALYPEPVPERRRNAETSIKSVLQEAFFKSGKSVTSASMWLQASDRNLPSSILVSGTGSSENQKDESLRAVLNHKVVFSMASFNLTAGFSGEKLKYVNPIASIISDNKSSTYTIKALNDLRINGSLSLRFFLSEEYSKVKSVNYDGKNKSKNIFSFGTAVSSNMGKKSSITLLLKETAFDEKFNMPDYSAGWNYFLSGKRKSWIKANFSRNSRTPSLNDIYWVPGGNPEIRNEYCHSAEVNSGFKYKTERGLDFNGEATFYTSMIRDMIQWLPGDYGYWSPSNVKDVNITGTEIVSGISGSSGSTSWSLKGHLSYTHSVYMSGGTGMKGNQMIYVPELECAGRAGIQYKAFFGVLDAGYTGKRFVTVDNTRSLKPYMLINLETGLKLNKEKQGYTIRFKLENLLDVNYELVSYYPMQGLSWHLSLEYRFRK